MFPHGLAAEYNKTKDIEGQIDLDVSISVFFDSYLQMIIQKRQVAQEVGGSCCTVTQIGMILVVFFVFFLIRTLI